MGNMGIRPDAYHSSSFIVSVDMSTVAVLAGSVSTVLFAASTLPMLIKAARTKELNSYSRGNLVLANVGNAVHSIYVFQLPFGPIWALHTFYVVTSALMLFWHLRYANRQRPQPAMQQQLPSPKELAASKRLRGSLERAAAATLLCIELVLPDWRSRSHQSPGG
jgi:uncharacterized protein with PQ loop repeat